MRAGRAAAVLVDARGGPPFFHLSTGASTHGRVQAASGGNARNNPVQPRRSFLRAIESRMMNAAKSPNQPPIAKREARSYRTPARQASDHQPAAGGGGLSAHRPGLYEGPPCGVAWPSEAICIAEGSEVAGTLTAQFCAAAGCSGGFRLPSALLSIIIPVEINPGRAASLSGSLRVATRRVYSL